MINKKLLTICQNDRLKEIDELVDNLIPNDNINKLIQKYSSELLDYEYIDSVHVFSTLKLKGSLRYINRYDKELRYGGLLIKIYQRDNKWVGVIKKINGKKYYISFDNNYIFYLENKSDNLISCLECFISNYDKGVYD